MDFQRFFEHSIDLCCFMTPQGDIQWLNRRWSETLGWSNEELKSRPIYAFLHPDDSGPCTVELDRILVGGEIVAFDNRIMKRDGGSLWVQWNLAPMGNGLLSVAARDIQEMVEARQRLAEQKQLLEMAADIVDMGHWHLEVGNQKLTWSPNVYEIFGVDPECFTPDTDLMLSMHHPDDQDRVKSKIERAVAKGSQATYKARVIHPDGSIHHIQTKVVCESVADQAPTAIFGVTQDITDHQEAILEARRLTKRSIQVERKLAEEQVEAAFLEKSLEYERELSAKQRRFVAMVSHEFRTPLSIIDGTAGILIRKGDGFGSDDRKGKLAKIRQSVNRLIGLIEGVLSSACLEAGQIGFEPVSLDLKSLIKDACDNQQDLSQRHVINVDIDSLPDSFLGDTKLLQQIVVNLLSNAVKYAPENEKIEVTGTTKDGYALVAVRDYGRGIPTDELPHLFERFFRASTSTGIVGTGIGLNLCKSFAEVHGGDILVDSIEGEGSIFTVKLPINQAATATSEAA